MLDERQIKAVLCRATGGNISQIARKAGVTRNTIYKWIELEEFKAEVAKCQQEFLTQGKSMISYLSVKALNTLQKLMYSDNEKIRFDAASKVLDKSHSNATKIEIDDSRDTKDNVPVDVLDKEIEEFEKE
ncbi:helix-turn-helix domain containing protein [Clostridium estertheticum]|uniref:helix-turn-helix domain-containing protein n=1 Tax=Clostridium estertheticum TaxID=238834 RepID=UPI001CF5C0EC|nr:helix-turn-helix domain-containing protein [Clostridium estertheticum]MCB2308991.1 helix-turn-helix domain containing protein [Clostridium estertheticum]MCB2346875.1 helix-turn-helix domain containing protein [Clostridium estertheticum]MCB2351813.1 helix-turn-helix domain containing protein [Clostridium estertheticum]WAG48417.1 helix-turn-helix domain containing protein [Clostridium estertheticum]